MSCDDLRVGGSLSAAGISGGVSINNSRIAVSDWSGLFGHTGLNHQLVRVAGRPGAVVAGDGLALERFHTLNLLITRWGPTGQGSLTEPTLGEQLWRNTDLILEYLAGGAFYLEVDDPDGTTRFVQAYAIDPAAIRQTEWRRLTLGLRSPWPYWWTGGAEQTDTINGVDTLAVGGNVDVYDPVLVFSGDGSFTHDDLGWVITIAGSGSAVTVDLGARTVTQAGAPAAGLMTRTNRDWGWLTHGATNNVTTTVSVDVTWRNQWS